MNKKHLGLVKSEAELAPEALTVDAYRVATAFLKIDDPNIRKEIIEMVERYAKVSNEKEESAS